MKRKSIKTAILVPSLAVLIAGIIVMVTVVGALSSSSTSALTDQLINARVNEYTNEFKAICTDVYSVLSAIAPTISSYIDPAFVADVADPRGDVTNILGQTLDSSDTIIAMWTCWEPNAFDGKDRDFAGKDYYDETGRFVPYVYKKGNDIVVEALVGYGDPVEGEYYQGAKNSGKPYITDPYMYNYGGTDTMIYSLAFPIIQDGKVKGVVGADIELQSTITTMNSGRILEDGYMYTLSPGGLIFTHPSEDYLLKPYSETWMNNYSADINKILANGGSFSVNAYSDVTKSNMSFLGNGVSVGETGTYWIVCGVVPEKTVNASSVTLLWTIIAIGFALILVVGITIFLIVRARLKELPILTATADAMALGDIDSASLDTGTGATKNEITLLGRSFSKMTDGIKHQADILTRISQGDYSVTAPVRSDKDVMNQAINKMLDSTNDTLGQINSSANQVSSGSVQIADGAQLLAQGATEQSATVEQLSASVTRVSEQTKENANMANDAKELGESIKISAEQGSQQMEQMMQAVKEINESSQSIGKVIKIIDDIAFQTNILALNAAVEAARAGQHGKGFAVVADEVRSLAAKSAEAAKNTNELIESSIAKAEQGAAISNETSESLHKIVEGILRSSELIANISSSSSEQSEAISKISKSIDEVSQVVQQNSATAEESAAASEEMSSQATLLQQLISQFKLKEGSSSAGYGNTSASAAPTHMSCDSTGFSINDTSKY